MSNKIEKFCKKCKTNTIHRLSKDKSLKKGGYFACSVCVEENSKRHRHNNWFRYLAQRANSRKKEKSEKMTEALLVDLYNNQNKCCALSGVPFNMEKSLYRPSLDRIDSSKGYTSDNIQLVLYIVNKMKRELNEEEFLAVCYNIADFYKCRLRPYLFNGVLIE